MSEAARRKTEDLLRHTLATLAYRGGKTLRGAPADFANFRAGDKTRTPLEILTHLGDLIEWALSICEGRHDWKPAKPNSWDEQVTRFFAVMEKFDQRLASDQPLGNPPGKLFQGPIADAFTHFGQIAMLRRMAGSPVKGENYFKADIAAGRVGADQAKPRVEFD
jgi:hypothetical protein